ncbi:hypothetical protein [Legionella taurinensis]|uniref:Uncharacterized protein n=1 Tax=Legionella taurinensis TaxID=70611 RepID=A0A3A5L3V0_9GAMM|nr:hypothetical protein [Legionella taurinensis]RJT46894.1 hypothetical protein D6J04_07635 [Legionella taurinensis]RJT66905.1 hypothetical protein D6J03_09470 [Legionella taurinensis]STY25364.1 Uncharacterised protein [Legionella taurinensis]
MTLIPETEIEWLVKAHNKRWHKYEDVCISFEGMKQRLSELKENLQRKKTSVTHPLTTSTPSMHRVYLSKKLVQRGGGVMSESLTQRVWLNSHTRQPLTDT